MKFYRNHYHTEGGGSAGFGFFRTKAAAIKAAKEADAVAIANAGEDQEPGSDMTDPVAEVVTVEPTNRGILWAINHYADHPDNG